MTVPLAAPAAAKALCQLSDAAYQVSPKLTAFTLQYSFSPSPSDLWKMTRLIQGGATWGLWGCCTQRVMGVGVITKTCSLTSLAVDAGCQLEHVYLA